MNTAHLPKQPPTGLRADLLQDAGDGPLGHLQQAQAATQWLFTYYDLPEPVQGQLQASLQTMQQAVQQLQQAAELA